MLGCWGKGIVVFLVLAVIGAIAGLASDGDEAPVRTTAASVQRTTTTAVSAREAAYREAVVTITTEVGSAMGTISALSDSYPFWTEDEEFQYAAALAVLLVMKNDLNKLSPPASWKQTHAHLLTAADYLHDAASLAASGIDNADAASLTAAANLMLKGSEEVSRATAAVPR